MKSRIRWFSGRRQRARAAVRLAASVAARAAATAPPVAVVAVVVGPDRIRVRLAVLPPELVRAGGDVVLGAVRVQARDDVDLAGVDELRNLGRHVRSGAGEHVQEREHDLDGQVLARVVLSDEEDARLGEVVRGVVRDARTDDVPALVRGAEREEVDDRRARRRHRLEVGHHLRVVVVPGVWRREVVGLHAADPHSVKCEPACLRVGAVELDVIGPVRLADVVALPDEKRALLARVDAVHDEALDRACLDLPVRSGRSGRHQEQRKGDEPPDDDALQHAGGRLSGRAGRGKRR